MDLISNGVPTPSCALCLAKTKDIENMSEDDTKLGEIASMTFELCQ